MSITTQEAAKAIAEKVAAAHKLINEAEALADEHKLSFHFERLMVWAELTRVIPTRTAAKAGTRRRKAAKENSMSDYYDSSESEESTETFNPHTVASSRQHAAEEVANRIKDIERLYKEAIALAEAFDINVAINLVSEHNRGHNTNEYVSWNSSSQNC